MGFVVLLVLVLLALWLGVWQLLGWLILIGIGLWLWGEFTQG